MRVRPPRDLRRERRRGGHSCWDHLIAAPLWPLHGVNLGRAGCWAQLRPALPAALQAPVAAAIDAHRAASVPAATDGDYVGTHWLASFALLALDPPG